MNEAVQAKGRRKRAWFHLLVFSPPHLLIFSEPDLNLVSSIDLLENLNTLVSYRVSLR